MLRHTLHKSLPAQVTYLLTFKGLTAGRILHDVGTSTCYLSMLNETANIR